MAQATNSHTTTALNPSFSAGPLVPTSHTGAPQPIAEHREPTSRTAVESAGAVAINRRSMMNMIVSAATLAATSAVSDRAMAQEDDDSELLSLAAEILRLDGLARRDEKEIIRLQAVWSDELMRLHETSEHNAAEQWNAVKALPESTEHAQLVVKADPYFAAADRLMKRLWVMPAKTREGKRAKVQVLFQYVLDDKWHHPDEDADWDIEMTRRLLFELAGVSKTDILESSANENVAAPTRAALLWAERQAHVVKNNALGVAYKSALDQLPAWAKSGPRLIAHDGTYCGDEVGWPLDVNVKPSEHQNACRVCRISPHDIKKDFEFSVSLFPKMKPSVRAAHRATMRARLRRCISLLREKRAEWTRSGLYENERQSLELSEAQWKIEDDILAECHTADAKAAGIMLSLQDNCSLKSSADDDSEMAMACVALELLLPQLTGLIREHVTFYLDNKTAQLRDMPFAVT